MADEHQTAELVERIASLPRSHEFQSVALTPDCDPRRLLADPVAAGVVASYERPERGLALVGIGTAERIEAPPGGGPASVREAMRRVLDRGLSGDAPGLRPRLLGGFRFNPEGDTGSPWAPFGAGWLSLPRVLLVLDGESSGVVIAPDVDPAEAAALVRRTTVPIAADGPRPSLEVERPINRSRWLDSVARIAEEVREGAYEKAVLACTQVLHATAPISVGRALARLRAGYPDCHLFTMTSGDTTFMGASPELLVGLSGGQVRALGLAGSLRRGETPEEDERLGAELLGSAKDRIEHETVVRAIRERLAPATDDLHAPNAPRLRKLPNIQHLSTDITGRVRAGVDILDLVQRLHPTPAVCGWPADVARAVITRHEDFDRGWYAGPVGWVDGAGDGEFAVALRSAVVQGDRAWLFAGNGIMGDSEPAAELAEVQLKFRPLSEALAS
ncbi:MAG: isochorismate synthase [Dehalococcoidia bacterium]|nr:isochorismate synthase [Dehalococcoidia bacterium]